MNTALARIQTIILSLLLFHPKAYKVYINCQILFYQEKFVIHFYEGTTLQKACFSILSFDFVKFLNISEVTEIEECDYLLFFSTKNRCY